MNPRRNTSYVFQGSWYHCIGFVSYPILVSYLCIIDVSRDEQTQYIIKQIGNINYIS